MFGSSELREAFDVTWILIAGLLLIVVAYTWRQLYTQRNKINREWERRGKRLNGVLKHLEQHAGAEQEFERRLDEEAKKGSDSESDEEG